MMEQVNTILHHIPSSGALCLMYRDFYEPVYEADRFHSLTLTDQFDVKL